jgi:enoyl-CoA hydratase
MSDAPAVLTERRGRVLVVTLNRPEQRNAVNLAVAEGIAAALDTLDADADLTLAVITGAGKGFCAGMDLKGFAEGARPWVGDRGFAGITRRSADKPLIAAIEGFAVAGGLEIALACDLIVAAKGAKLGIPEVKRSLVAGQQAGEA